MKFFTPEEEQRIVYAIQDAEKKTSGEIRVHVAHKHRGGVYESAVKTFEKIGMTKTAERNGVLIYLAIKNREFSVIGDVGIHDKLPPGFWEKVRDSIQADFKRGEIVQGLVDGIKTCGTELSKYFPRKADDKNELSDGVSEG